MRICIDATPLLLRSAGVKNYLYYWILHLRQAAPEASIVTFPFFSRIGQLNHEESVAGRWATLAGLVLLHFANSRNNPLMNLIGRRVDVFHASQQSRNPPRNTRLTATVYDMTCWLMPEMHSSANVAAAKRFAEQVMTRADGLIAISESTRSDAARILGLRPERMEVIYPGVAGAFFRITPEIIQTARMKYALSRPYVLTVGTVEPRKNLALLLDGYQRMALSTQQEFQLVVAGPLGWADRTLVERLRSATGGVRYLGYVPETDLPGLTAGATVFVYPSLYEGFGLPVAQAMAAGVPVVTSNVSSLPEITGGSALLVDPRSVEDLRAALEGLLLSPARQAELGQHGAIRAQQYRWEVCAEKTLRFFGQL
jgi:glycosyltransferase involved in cell wall biosynthesis